MSANGQKNGIKIVKYRHLDQILKELSCAEDNSDKVTVYCELH